VTVGSDYTASAEPDPCIGRYLPGIWGCCCGHGDVSSAYVDPAGWRLPGVCLQLGVGDEGVNDPTLDRVRSVALDLGFLGNLDSRGLPRRPVT
jgi:hypothetical protein